MHDVQKILEQLKIEREKGYKNGIYYLTQVELAYNSNRIEGNRLKKEHTESLFTTKSILTDKDEIIRSDDVIETTNHFRAFDYLIDSLDDALNEIIIKKFHQILKTGTSDADIPWFRVGEYKKMPNMVAGMDTTPPKDVEKAMENLLDDYNLLEQVSFNDILRFHVNFEKIHPFQDGNGRVGRLIMFRECLKNNIVPFIIDSNHKEFYYRGLREYFKDQNYLRDTCLSAQDKYKVYCEKYVNG